MSGYRRYDWPSVKMVFVEGSVDDDGERRWLNLREVAELFDVPYVRVREHSAKEGWTDERSAYVANIERVRQDRRVDQLAKDAVDFDKRALQMARTGMQLVGARLAEIGMAVAEAQKRTAEGQPATSPLPVVDAREVATLIGAAGEAYSLAGRALGDIPTTRHEITGPGGAPIRTGFDIREEMTKDDPDRLAKFLMAAQRAGLTAMVTDVSTGGTGPPALNAAPSGSTEGDEPEGSSG